MVMIPTHTLRMIPTHMLRTIPMRMLHTLSSPHKPQLPLLSSQLHQRLQLPLQSRPLLKVHFLMSHPCCCRSCISCS